MKIILGHQVWSLLGTHKKLQEASNTIENANRKTRTIERKLRNVQELPVTDTASILGNIDEIEEAEVDGD